MAKKAVKKSQSEPSSSTAAVSSQPADTTTGDAGASAPVVPKGSSGKAGGDEVIRVNTSSLLELKHALDDAVKDHFGRPTGFTPSHVHEDVRLGLGWSSIAVAAATGYHAYIVPFHVSKGWVAVGVFIYALISAVQAYYTRYIEQDIIFTGKRRTFASRISTETLTISSHPTPAPMPLSFLPFLGPPLSESLQQPSYRLSLKYVHSGNGGKALIHECEKELERGFGDFFDQTGRICSTGVRAWLEGVERDVVGQ